jgi:hypothetical protein
MLITKFVVLFLFGFDMTYAVGYTGTGCMDTHNLCDSRDIVRNIRQFRLKYSLQALEHEVR